MMSALRMFAGLCATATVVAIEMREVAVDVHGGVTILSEGAATHDAYDDYNASTYYGYDYDGLGAESAELTSTYDQYYGYDYDGLGAESAELPTAATHSTAAIVGQNLQAAKKLTESLPDPKTITRVQLDSCTVGARVQCPLSRTWCEGDQCCPSGVLKGGNATGTFPCPSASQSFTLCESPEKQSNCLVTCSFAEPQSPRDLTSQAEGKLKPKAATLTKSQADDLELVNMHYHLGAEHKTEDFSDEADTLEFEAARAEEKSSLIDMSLMKHAPEHSEKKERPGFMCTKKDLTSEQLAEYNFEKCLGEDVKVGNSYEIHYVHSSAGYSKEMLKGSNVDAISDGLGGAANGRGQLNPMIVVQAQVFQIVNGGATLDDMHEGWQYNNDTLKNSVMYAGSTTGTHFNDDICSPYAVTWHVDKKCHRISPESFDKFCKMSHNIGKDLKPHGSRMLVKPAWVVKPSYVKALSDN